MKLKNSQILLIVLSLFLLISIGSVCAADNNDVQSIEQNTDTSTVLSDDSLSAGDDSQEENAAKNTQIECNDTKIKYGDKAEIPITVKDNESNVINVNKTSLKVSEGNASVAFDYNNSKIIISNSAAGKHNLLIEYLGNSAYNASSKNIVLSVVGNRTINVPASVTVNSTNQVVVPISLTDEVDQYEVIKNNLTLTFSYKDGNNTITKDITDFTLTDGKINFKYAFDVTTGDLIIKYNDNGKIINKTVPLKYIQNANIVAITTVADYKTGKFVFQLIDTDTNKPIANKKISFTIVTGNVNTGFSGTTDANGTVTFYNKDLYIYDFSNSTFTASNIPVGKQRVDVKTDDSTVTAPTLTTNLTINILDVTISAKNFKAVFNSGDQMEIKVVNKKTSEAVSGLILKLELPKSKEVIYYVQTDENGIAKINAAQLLPGDYNVTISSNDTKNSNPNPITRNITITKRDVIISTKDYSVSFNTGASAKIIVKDKETGKRVANAILYVRIYTGSKYQDYLFQANDKGEVKFSASLGVGKHKMVVQSGDSRYDAKAVTNYITVSKASAKIKAPKVTTYYKGGKYLTIKLVNTKKDNQPIYDAKLNIKVFISSTRYYNYNGATGANGKLKISLDMFTPKTYKVIITPNDSKNFTAKSVTTQFVVKKAPTKLTPAKLTSKKGVSKNFKVKVTNSKTKKVITGVKVKVKVYTGKNYKTYTLKTNSKGIANLNVKSLSVGTHKVVVNSANKYCVASAKKSSIKITKK